MNKLADYVVVFDLDDTLYKEIDYVRSGRRHVYDLIAGIEEKMPVQTLLEYSLEEDVWAILGEAMSLPEPVQESMLWAYRLHVPDIVLDARVAECIAILQVRAKALAVLTDGRTLTQQLKLRALGLEHLPVYISEMWGGLKPAPARFKAIEARWPDAKYMYVGDNPKKDFFMPNQLSWVTVGIQDDGRNIHPQHQDGLSDDYLPMHWINCMTELEGVL
jgi:putative hydrolase of the HAD superfamily